MARLQHYGSHRDREDGRSALGAGMSLVYDVDAGGPLVYLEISVPFSNTTLSIGAQNVLDTDPDGNPGAVTGVGNRYGQFGPPDLNGGYYYTRIGFGWGS